MRRTTILRRSNYHRMPWKNGGGETTEIAISPPAAGLNDFDWRISMALVKSDGPFSVFDGIDRTLCILEGHGLRLVVGGAPHELNQESPPFPFAGEAPVRAEMVDGAITDLNVMSRRATYRHDVRRLNLQGIETFTPASGVVAIFCHAGIISVTAPGVDVVLAAHDTLIVEAPTGARQTGSWNIIAEAPATVFVITLTLTS